VEAVAIVAGLASRLFILLQLAYAHALAPLVALLVLLQLLADEGAELCLAKRLRRPHVVHILQQCFILCLLGPIDMSLTIDEQALSDVLDSQTVVIRDVQLVEALSNNFVQVFVEELRDSLNR